MTELKLSVDDRFQLTDVPLALPGNCAVCGYAGGPDGDGRKFIDWGLSLEFFGAVIFCTHCVESVARMLGYIAPQVANRLQEEIRSLGAEVSEKDGEIVRLVDALNSLNRVGHLLLDKPATGNQKTGQENKDAGGSGSKPSVGHAKSSDSGGPTSLRKTDSNKSEDEFVDDTFDI